MKSQYTTIKHASIHPPHGWLGESAQLDIGHHRIQITAKRLTQLKASPAEKALAIHDWVRRWPYAPFDQSGTLLASEILQRGKGGAFTKGIAFVALCRAAGIPSRLRFLLGPGSFIGGFVDKPPRRALFAIAEVWIDQQWVLTDGYVIDPALWVAAKRRLQIEGRRLGYGICVHSPAQWDAKSHQIQQMDPSTAERALRTHNLGSYDDIASFYRSQTDIPLPGWLSNIRFYRTAMRITRRAQELRQWRPREDTQSIPAWAPTQSPADDFVGQPPKKAANHSLM